MLLFIKILFASVLPRRFYITDPEPPAAQYVDVTDFSTLTEDQVEEIVDAIEYGIDQLEWDDTPELVEVDE